MCYINRIYVTGGACTSIAVLSPLVSSTFVENTLLTKCQGYLAFG